MNFPGSLILLPLGGIYSAVTRARMKAYASGWLPVSKLPAPVISVGNLTTGGTGKTPLVEWVCRAIGGDTTETPKRVCVLTRGYGRANVTSQVVVSDGSRVLAGELESGDEPFLLAKNLIGKAAVIANSDRYAAGNWAIENLGSEVFILDDGFQHLQLARDFDIVTIDATNPWGGNRLLPVGRLREQRHGLSRADCVVITRCEQSEKVDLLKQEIKNISNAMPVFTSRMITTQIQGLNGQARDRSTMNLGPAAAFCGVGNPQSFFDHLRNEKIPTVLTHSFTDHHHYTQADIDRLVDKAKTHDAQVLITTAKDAPKLATLNIGLPCFVVEIKISIDEENRLAEAIRTVAVNRL